MDTCFQDGVLMMFCPVISRCQTFRHRSDHDFDGKYVTNQHWCQPGTNDFWYPPSNQRWFNFKGFTLVSASKRDQGHKTGLNRARTSMFSRVLRNFKRLEPPPRKHRSSWCFHVVGSSKSVHPPLAVRKTGG
jgi:hypothetical protein